MHKISAGAMAAIAAILTSSAPLAKPLPPPVYAIGTPSLLTGALYADLSGILRPPNEPSPRPMWWSYLSEETGALREELAAIEAETGQPAFDYDWLCQCRDTRKFQAQPRIVVESSSDMRADLRVAVTQYGGNQRVLHLLFVNEGGWRIDDIVDDDGRRYTRQLARAIARRNVSPARLPDPMRD